jgi:hypothetical protein
MSPSPFVLDASYTQGLETASADIGSYLFNALGPPNRQTLDHSPKRDKHNNGCPLSVYSTE